MINSWPRLYKKTSCGSIQYWEIAVHNHEAKAVAEIVTMFGQVGTHSPQTTSDYITEGKNLGKANETTYLEQAIAEAAARHTKQKKKCYVESIEDAKAGLLDKIIEGGVNPMLAHKYSEQGHKIKWPAYVQPKLDGIRCIAVITDGKCELWTRTRKRINSLPHIVKELEGLFPGQTVTTDGECYSHKFKTNFEHIVHLVRQDSPDKECTDVEYHLYDVVNDKPFKDRLPIFSLLNGQYVKPVLTESVESEDLLMDYFTKYVDQGFEGCMVRNANALYVNKRSYDLLKVKEFDDAEFKIIGYNEGRGKLAGHVGSFNCETADGLTFKAKMDGDTYFLQQCFDDHSIWQGKMLTVKFQGYTKYSIPRFPIGLRLRDYE